MSKTGQAIQAIENGLLTANTIKGLPQDSYHLGERMAYYNVPGFSIALVEHERIAWAKGYGILEAGKDKPVTDETIFQLASISKPVAAMTALSLVEAELLDLDSDVNSALKSWQIPENEHTTEHKVTLRGLLSHTAGLTVYGYRGYPAGAKLPTLQQVLDGKPPANSDPVRVMQTPRKAFSLSSGGYVLIQQLIEDATSLAFADLAQELIFDKLGMTNSSYESILPEAFITQAATAHQDSGRPVPGKWHTYPEQATASLWSTPSDLARLVIEIIKSHKGQSDIVLSTEMTRQMLTPQDGCWMGLGFVSVDMDGWRRFDHPGWNEGYHSYLAGFRDAGQGLVWMANGENGRFLGYEVMRALASVFEWPELQAVEKSISPVDPAHFAPYAGKYRFIDYPEFGVEIINEGEYLILQEYPDGIRYQLYSQSESDFFCLHRPEAITFNKSDHGSVGTMLIGPYSQLERVE